jgi:hypothetical protein
MATTNDTIPAYHADEKGHYDSDGKNGGVTTDASREISVQDELTYQFDDSRKLGITSSVFVILNKMIGTGIFSTPSGIFAATGSVGVSLFLWIIGGILTFAGLSAFVEFGLAVSNLVFWECMQHMLIWIRSLEVVVRRTTWNASIVTRSCLQPVCLPLRCCFSASRLEMRLLSVATAFLPRDLLLPMAGRLEVSQLHALPSPSSCMRRFLDGVSACSMF